MKMSCFCQGPSRSFLRGFRGVVKHDTLPDKKAQKGVTESVTPGIRAGGWYGMRTPSVWVVPYRTPSVGGRVPRRTLGLLHSVATLLQFCCKRGTRFATGFLNFSGLFPHKNRCSRSVSATNTKVCCIVAIQGHSTLYIFSPLPHCESFNNDFFCSMKWVCFATMQQVFGNVTENACFRA